MSGAARESGGAKSRPSAGELPGDLGGALRVFVRHPSPRLLAGALVLALAVRPMLGGASWGDAVVVGVVAAGWPLLEWTIHVFVLHARPVLGLALDWDVPRKHRAHHRDPADLELVFIPPSGLATGLPLLVGIAYAVTPAPALAGTAVAAVLLLALHYEWVHFLVHTRYRPRSRPYARLARHHLLHHFRNEHYWFGVTRLGGDRLLGTAPPPGEVPTSPTCRALEAPAR